MDQVPAVMRIFAVSFGGFSAKAMEPLAEHEGSTAWIVHHLSVALREVRDAAEVPLYTYSLPDIEYVSEIEKVKQQQHYFDIMGWQKVFIRSEGTLESMMESAIGSVLADIIIENTPELKNQSLPVWDFIVSIGERSVTEICVVVVFLTEKAAKPLQQIAKQQPWEQSHIGTAMQMHMASRN